MSTPEKFDLMKPLKQIEGILSAVDQATIIAVTDTNGIITHVNQNFCNLSKYTKEELINHNHSLINSGHHSTEFFQEMWKTIKEGLAWEGEIKNKAKDGTYYWLKTTIVPILNQEGNPLMYISLRTDITDRKQAEERLLNILYYDELTGLPNRKFIEEEVSELVKHKQSFTLIYIDIDNFKYINATIGNGIGDEFLKFVANKLQEEVVKPDLIGRLIGDEFIILLKGDFSSEELERKIKCYTKVLGTRWEINHHSFFVSVSIGVVKSTVNDEESIDLFRKANTAMLQAKREGKGSWLFYREEFLESNKDVIEIAQQLQHALANEELTLYYQPQLNLANGITKGLEALIRWKHPEKGFISPAKFIPIAEETGQIYEIEKWVIQTALKQKKQLDQLGFEQIQISINLSSKTLMNERRFNEVLKLLSAEEIDLSKIIIEITETSILSNIDLSIERLRNLKALGIKVALDDFGTGYSSLNYLRNLPIDIVKLDRTFVGSIEENSKDSIIIKSVLHLAQNLNYKVVAEGIETVNQLDFLKQNNCEVGQGFLMSKPQPLENLIDKLKQIFML